ncbi:hypothetical protein LP7551_02728 [Roseibium album]|nr:hypothetical protein LP7551_02728 [Roseibium album]
MVLETGGYNSYINMEDIMKERTADRTLSSAGLLLLLTAAVMIMFAVFGQQSFNSSKPNFVYHNFVD